MKKKLTLILLGTILIITGSAIIYYAIIGDGIYGNVVLDFAFGISQLSLGISQFIIGMKTGNENWNEINK